MGPRSDERGNTATVANPQGVQGGFNGAALG